MRIGSHRYYIYFGILSFEPVAIHIRAAELCWRWRLYKPDRNKTYFGWSLHFGPFVLNWHRKVPLLWGEYACGAVVRQKDPRPLGKVLTPPPDYFVLGHGPMNVNIDRDAAGCTVVVMPTNAHRDLTRGEDSHGYGGNKVLKRIISYLPFDTAGRKPAASQDARRRFDQKKS